MKLSISVPALSYTNINGKAKIVYFNKDYIQIPSVSSLNLSARTYSVILVSSSLLIFRDLPKRKILTLTTR